jgi:phosphopantothenoylcysteine decarboxylase
MMDSAGEEEWKDWKKLGDPVLHIDLRDWADIFLVAPLSAHTLAKLANGLCDDTLTCVARAWDLGHGTRPAKPILLAPAMNTAMWEHPLTLQQLKTIQGFGKDSSASGISVIAPVSKMLACGEVGVGALASVDDILETVKRTWEESS